MLPRAIVFLLAAGITTAAVLKKDNFQQCSGFCIGKSKFRYEPGLTYVYDYNGDVISSISGSSSEQSRLHLTATAEIQVLSKCDYTLQVKNAVLEDSVPKDKDIRKPVSRQVEFSKALEANALHFSFQDGVIDHLCPSEVEPVWVLNIKRGILSAFQTSIESFEKKKKAVVFEKDISGSCEATYTVQNNSYTSSVHIKKWKDFLGCTEYGSRFHSIQTMQYGSIQKSQPLVKSKQDCKQTINKDKILEQTTCNEVHLFRPFSNGENGAVTKVSQNLVYRFKYAHKKTSYYRQTSKQASLSYQQDFEDDFAKADHLHTVLSLVQLLETKLNNGIDKEVPHLFSSLVQGLKYLNHTELLKVFSEIPNKDLRKMFLDSMPVVGTANGIKFMINLYRNREITVSEFDSWVTSLAYQKKVTIDMLEAVSTVLEKEFRTQAVLSITSMIHNYCTIDLFCRNKLAVKKILFNIERVLGDDCQPTEDNSIGEIKLALRGIGNAGITNALSSLLKCHQHTNPIEVQVLAISAFRRFSCEKLPTSKLLEKYLDVNTNSEARITAYLAVMQCPSLQILNSVIASLHNEDINQVGSFVWTHLNNLQETSARWKQNIREMLYNEILQTKFNTDATKYSRNYEKSIFFDSIDAGATIESNVIFSEQSYLPRSANLNLTVDLFGESINLFEVGSRAEGFEDIVENIFSPNGFFPDNSVRNFLQKLRGVGDNSKDEILHNLDKITSEFNSTRNLRNNPFATVYARIFGNEFMYSQFNGRDIEKYMESALHSKDLFLKLLKRENIDFSKSFSIIDASYVIPTIIGLPLKFSAEGSGSVSLKLNGHVDFQSPTSFSLNGQLMPSAAISIIGSMVVDAHVAKAGLKSKNKLHTNSYLDGKLTIKGDEQVEFKLHVPREKMEIIDVSMEIIALHREEEVMMLGVKTDREESHGCTSQEISDISGLKLCSELSFPNATRVSQAPYFPLTGPLKANVTLLKTDSFDSYILSYKTKRDQEISSDIAGNYLKFYFDTPNSQIDRQIQILFNYNKNKSMVEAVLFSPFIKFQLSGAVLDNENEKSVHGYVIINENEIFSLNALVKSQEVNQFVYYEPSLTLDINRKRWVQLHGKLQYEEGMKYSMDLTLTDLTEDPLHLNGEINIIPSGCRINATLQSSGVSGTVDGTFINTQEVISSDINMEYSVFDSNPEYMTFSAKLGHETDNAIDIRELYINFQMSAIQEYNILLDWKLHRGTDLFIHKGSLQLKNSTSSFSQTYINKPLNFIIGFSLLSEPFNVDYLAHIELKVSHDSALAGGVFHLGPTRKYKMELSLKNDVITMTLLLPKVEALLRGYIRGTGKSSYEFQITSSISLFRSSGKVQHNFNLNGSYVNKSPLKLQDHEFQLQFDGIWSGRCSGKYFSSNDRIDQWFKLVIADETYHEDFTYLWKSRQQSAELQFQYKGKVYTGSITSTSVRDGTLITLDLFLGKRIVADITIKNCAGGQNLSVNIYWNKAQDETEKLQFSLLVNGNENNFVLEYPGQSVVGQLFILPNEVNATLEWGQSKRIDFQLTTIYEQNKIGFILVLQTPFEGLQNQRLETELIYGLSGGLFKMLINWQDKTAILKMDALKLSEKSSRTHFDIKGQLLSNFEFIPNMSLQIDHSHKFSNFQLIDTVISLSYNSQKSQIEFHWKNDTDNYLISLVIISPIELLKYFQLKWTFTERDFTKNSMFLYSWATEKQITVSLDLREESGMFKLTTPFEQCKLVKVDYNISRMSSNFMVIADVIFNVPIFTVNINLSVRNSSVEGLINIMSHFTKNITAEYIHRRNLDLITQQISINQDQHNIFSYILNSSYDSFLSNLKVRLNISILNENIVFKLQNSWKENEFQSNFYGNWNQRALNIQFVLMKVFENDKVYIQSDLALTGSALTDKLHFIFLHEQMNHTAKTVFKSPSGLNIIHTLTIKDSLTWSNKVEINFRKKTFLIYNNQDFSNSQFQHQFSIKTNDLLLESTLFLDLNNNLDFQGTLVTPWSFPISFKAHTNLDDTFAKLEFLLVYAENKEIKCEIISELGLWNSTMSLNMESPLFPPLYVEIQYNLRTNPMTGYFSFKSGNVSLDTIINIKLENNCINSVLQIKTSDAILFSSTIDLDLKALNANIEILIYDKKITFVGTVNFGYDKYQVSLKGQTFIKNFENLFVLINIDTSQILWLNKLSFVKNSDFLEFSRNIDVTADTSTLSISLTSNMIQNMSAYVSHKSVEPHQRKIDVNINWFGETVQFFAEKQISEDYSYGSLKVKSVLPLADYEDISASLSFENGDEKLLAIHFVKNNIQFTFNCNAQITNTEGRSFIVLNIPFSRFENIEATMSYAINENSNFSSNFRLASNKFSFDISTSVAISENELLATLVITHNWSNNPIRSELAIKRLSQSRKEISFLFIHDQQEYILTGSIIKHSLKKIDTSLLFQSLGTGFGKVEAGLKYDLESSSRKVLQVFLNLPNENNDFIFVVSTPENQNIRASVNITGKLPIIGISDISAEGIYDVSKKYEKFIMFKTQGNKNNLLSAEITINKNSFSAVVRILGYESGHLSGEYSFSGRKKTFKFQMKIAKTYQYALTSVAYDYTREIEISVTTPYQNWNKLHLYSRTDLKSEKKSVQLFAMKNKKHFDLLGIGTFSVNRSSLTIKVSAPNVEDIIIDASYDFTDNVLINFQIRMDRQIIHSNLNISDGYFQFILETPFSWINTLNLSSVVYKQQESLMFKLNYKGIGTEDMPFMVEISANKKTLLILMDNINFYLGYSKIEAKFDFNSLFTEQYHHFFAHSLFVNDHCIFKLTMTLTLPSNGSSDAEFTAMLDSKFPSNRVKYHINTLMNCNFPPSYVNIFVKRNSEKVFGLDVVLKKSSSGNIDGMFKLVSKYIFDCNVSSVFELLNTQQLLNINCTVNGNLHNGRIIFDNIAKSYLLEYFVSNDISEHFLLDLKFNESHIGFLIETPFNQLKHLSGKVEAFLGEPDTKYFNLFLSKNDWYTNFKSMMNVDDEQIIYKLMLFSTMKNLKRIVFLWEYNFLESKKSFNFDVTINDKSYKFTGLTEKLTSSVMSSIRIITPFKYIQDINFEANYKSNENNFELKGAITCEKIQLVQILSKFSSNLKGSGSAEIKTTSQLFNSEYHGEINYNLNLISNEARIEAKIVSFYLNASTLFTLKQISSNELRIELKLDLKNPVYQRKLNVNASLINSIDKIIASVIYLNDDAIPRSLFSNLTFTGDSNYEAILSFQQLSYNVFSFSLHKDFNFKKRIFKGTISCKWGNENPLSFGGNLQLMETNIPSKFELIVTTPFKLIEKSSFTFIVMPSTDGFNLNSKILWIYNSKQHDTTLKIDHKFKNSYFMSKMFISSSGIENISTYLMYKENSDEKVVEAVLQYGILKTAILANIYVLDYKHSNINITLLTPISGLTELHLIEAHNIEVGRSIAKLSLSVENNFGILSCEFERKDKGFTLNISLKSNVKCFEDWRFIVLLDKSVGIGAEIQLLTNKHKYIAGKLECTPELIWLEINTPFKGFENLTGEIVFMQGNSINVIRTAATWGSNTIELKGTFQYTDDDVLKIDIMLTTPWTEVASIIATYENKNEHILQLSFFNGITEKKLFGKLKYSQEKLKFNLQFETLLGSNEDQHLFLNAGYAILESEKEVYFHGGIDKFTFHVKTTGILNDTFINGSSVIETSMKHFEKVFINLYINLDCTETKTAAIYVNKNNEIYELNGNYTFSSSVIGGYLSIKTPDFCVENTHMMILFDYQNININWKFRDKNIFVKYSYEFSLPVSHLDAEIQVPFINLLTNVSLSSLVDFNLNAGYVKIHWAPQKDVTFQANFQVDELSLTFQSPFEYLSNFMFNTKFVSKNNNLSFLSSFEFNQYKLSLEAILTVIKSEYNLLSKLSWNKDKNITLNIKGENIFSGLGSKLENYFELMTPFDSFDYIYANFYAEIVDKKQLECLISVQSPFFELSKLYIKLVNDVYEKTATFQLDRNKVITVIKGVIKFEDSTIHAFISKEFPLINKLQYLLIFKIKNEEKAKFHALLSMQYDDENVLHNLTGIIVIGEHNTNMSLQIMSSGISKFHLGGLLEYPDFKNVELVLFANENKIMSLWNLKSLNFNAKFILDIPLVDTHCNLTFTVSIGSDQKCINLNYEYNGEIGQIEMKQETKINDNHKIMIFINLPSLLLPVTCELSYMFDSSSIIMNSTFTTGIVSHSANIEVRNYDETLQFTGTLNRHIRNKIIVSFLMERDLKSMQLNISEIGKLGYFIKHNIGSINLVLYETEHRLNYKLECQDKVGGSIEIETPILKSKTFNFSLYYRKTDRSIVSECIYFSGLESVQIHFALDKGEVTNFSLILTTGEEIIMKCVSNLSLQHGKSFGHINLFLFGTNNVVSFKKYLTQPFDIDFQVICPLISVNNLHIIFRTTNISLYTEFVLDKYGNSNDYLTFQLSIEPETQFCHIDIQMLSFFAIKHLQLHIISNVRNDDTYQFVFNTQYTDKIGNFGNISLICLKSDSHFVGNLNAGISYTNYRYLIITSDIPLTFTNNITFNFSFNSSFVNFMTYNSYKSFDNLLNVEFMFKYNNKHCLSARLLVLSTPKILVEMQVNTPFSNLDQYSLTFNKEVSVNGKKFTQYSLGWNKKEIVLQYYFVFGQNKIILKTDLRTPFNMHEHYSVKLEYQNESHKVVTATLYYPGLEQPIGFEFDYKFKNIVDANLIFMFNIPFLSHLNHGSIILVTSYLTELNSFNSLLAFQFDETNITLKLNTIFNPDDENKFEFISHWNGKDFNFKLLYMINIHSISKIQMEFNTPFASFQQFLIKFWYRNNKLDTKVVYNLNEVLLFQINRKPSLHIQFNMRSSWSSMFFKLTQNSDKIVSQWTVLSPLNQFMFESFISINTVKVFIENFNISINLPQRTINLMYLNQKNFTMFKKEIVLTWEKNRSIGYLISIDVDNDNSIHRNQFIFPLRSFECNWFRKNKLIQSVSPLVLQVELLWDASYDRSKVINISIESMTENKTNIIAYHPALKQGIQISTLGYYQSMSTKLLAFREIEIIYSSKSEDVINFRYHLFYDELESYLNASVVISHLPSSVDLIINLNHNSSDIKSISHIFISYMAFENLLYSFETTGVIDYLLSRAVLTIGTSNNILILEGYFWNEQSDVTCLAGSSKINQNEPTEIQVCASSVVPNINVLVKQNLKHDFAVHVGFPSWQEMKLEAKHSQIGYDVQEFSFNLKLNNSKILWTYIKWLPEISKAKFSVIEDYSSYFKVTESLTESFVKFLQEDSNKKFSYIKQELESTYMTLRFYYENEMGDIINDISRTEKYFNQLYVKNDFYIQDIVRAGEVFLSLSNDALTKLNSGIKFMFSSVASNLIKLTQYMKQYLLFEVLIEEFKILFDVVQVIYSEAWDSLLILKEKFYDLLMEVQEFILHCNKYAHDLIFKFYQWTSVAMRNIIGVIQELIWDGLQLFDPIISLCETYLQFLKTNMRVIENELSDFVLNVTSYIFNLDIVQDLMQLYRNCIIQLKEAYLFEKLIDIIETCIEELTEAVESFHAFFFSLNESRIKHVDPISSISSISFVRKSINGLYQKMSWMWNYYDVSGKLVDIVKVIIKELSSSSTATTNIILFKPEAGVIELSQELPVKWYGFNELPQFESFNLHSLVGLKREQLSKTFSVAKIYGYFTNTNVTSLLLPSKKFAVINGNKHFITFDNRYFEFEGKNSYLLANDFVNEKFSLIINYEMKESFITDTTFTLLTDDVWLDVGKNILKLNGQRSEYPIFRNELQVTTTGRAITVSTSFGLKINFYENFDISIIELPGWYFGKIGGLLGSVDNEAMNDISFPNGTRSYNIESFGESWRVRKNNKNYIQASSAVTINEFKPETMCNFYFKNMESPFQECFDTIDPSPYFQLCSSKSRTHTSDIGVCKAALIYVLQCQKHGLGSDIISLPDSCVMCDKSVEFGKPIHLSPEKNELKAAHPVNIVLLIQESKCLKELKYYEILSKLESALLSRKISPFQYSVIGFGGSGNNVSHSHTYNGKIWMNFREAVKTLNNLSLEDSNSTNAVEALKYATTLPFNPYSSKVFILIQCEVCQDKGVSNFDMESISNMGIHLHILQANAFKMRINHGKLSHIYGMDFKGIFSSQSVKNMSASTTLLKQVAIPKDKCSTLAFNTNGTLFSLDHISTRQRYNNAAKKFLQVWSSRVASSVNVPECQICECRSDEYGFGYTYCFSCPTTIALNANDSDGSYYDEYEEIETDA